MLVADILWWLDAHVRNAYSLLLRPFLQYSVQRTQCRPKNCVSFLHVLDQRTINPKPAFRVSSENVRVCCASFCHRLGAALQWMRKESLVKVCNKSTLDFDTRQRNVRFLKRVIQFG